MNSWYETGLGTMEAGGMVGPGGSGGLMTIGTLSGDTDENAIKRLTAELSAGLRTRNYYALSNTMRKASPYIERGKPALVSFSTWNPFVLVYGSAQATLAAAPASALLPSMPTDTSKNGGGGLVIQDMPTPEEIARQAQQRAAEQHVRDLQAAIVSLTARLQSTVRSGNLTLVKVAVADGQAQVALGRRTVSVAVWNTFTAALAAAQSALTAAATATSDVKNQVDNVIDNVFIEDRYGPPGYYSPPVESLPVEEGAVEGMSTTTKLLIAGGVVVAVYAGYKLLKG